MNLSPDRFFHDLDRLFPQADFLIAYSGGLDSSVLLHLCAVGAGDASSKRFLALHVNHGLHRQAGKWAGHCIKTCEGLDFPCRVLTVDGAAEKGQSPEEAARKARYRALLQAVEANTVVLTAQHQDDQTETILLQMLRGGGLRGLSGMPVSIAFGPGVMHRPFLRFSRSTLQLYADVHRLTWMDDPSNLDTSLDRNYLRREVIPRMQERWPGMAKTLARSGRHCAEAQKIIDRQVESWSEPVMDLSRNTILISKLTEFAQAEQRLILRHWIQRRGFRCPHEVNLNQIISEVMTAAPDRFPIIHWNDAEVRRYRNELFIMKPLGTFDQQTVIPWSVQIPLSIPNLGGTLECLRKNISDPQIDLLGSNVSVRFRTGGERCRLPGRKGSRPLKKIFQELAVPPWERNRIPLVYVTEELAAVGVLFVCEPFQDLEITFRWTQAPVQAP